jgi:uncharacterized protein CbrC (UPF0167 family)
MRKAHKYCNNNIEYLQEPQMCVCIYCGSRFHSSEIKEYTMDNNALCPYCWIDTVIGEKSGFTFTDDELKNMYEFFFNSSTDGVSEHIKDLKLLEKFHI